MVLDQAVLVVLNQVAMITIVQAVQWSCWTANVGMSCWLFLDRGVELVSDVCCLVRQATRTTVPTVRHRNRSFTMGAHLQNRH